MSRGLPPLIPRRKRHDGLHVGAGGSAHFDGVGMEAPDHRRIHGIGRAERAEQKWSSAAEPFSTTAPDRIDANDIGRRLIVQRTMLHRPPRIHRQLFAQRHKSGVHFAMRSHAHALAPQLVAATNRPTEISQPGIRG